MKKVWSTLLLLFIFYAGAQAQYELLEAWIDLNPQLDEVITIEGNAKSLTNEQGDYNYTLKVSAFSQQGNSNNTQSGTFTLMAKEEATVSKVNLTRVENQKIEVVLTILLGHIEIAKAVYRTSPESKAQADWSYSAQQVDSTSKVSQPLRVGSEVQVIDSETGSISKIRSEKKLEELQRDSPMPPSKKSIVEKTEIKEIKDSLKVASSPSLFTLNPRLDSVAVFGKDSSNSKLRPGPDVSSFEELEINGLIIDETRSKIGRDFYDIFYRKWQAPSGAESFSIILKEYPTRGRIARVGIEVNGKIIFRPVLQPREEIIEMVAAQAVNVVRKHVLDLKQINSELESQDQSGSGIF